MSHLFPTKLKHKISHDIFLTYMASLNKLFGLSRKFMLHFFILTMHHMMWLLSKSLTSLSICTSKSLCLQSFAGCLTEGTKVCVLAFQIVAKEDQRNRTFPLKNRMRLLSSEWQFGAGFKHGFLLLSENRLVASGLYKGIHNVKKASSF